MSSSATISGTKQSRLISSFLRSVPDSLFSLIFPADCRICHSQLDRFSWTPVCNDCWNSVQRFDGAACGRCGIFVDHPLDREAVYLCGNCQSEPFDFEAARSFAWYDGNLRLLIHLLKFDGYKPLAKPLGRLAAEVAREMSPSGFDIVLPVPLHRSRQRTRGFNQSALLASNIAREFGLSDTGKDCVRVRNTRPQTGLNAKERHKNVKGAFQVPRPESVKSRRILLVDDVMTTGATANACARALMEAGAKSVSVVTLARVHPSRQDVL
jgi:ComF family protein